MTNLEIRYYVNVIDAFAIFCDTSFNKAILLLMDVRNNVLSIFIQTHYFQDTNFLPYPLKACCYILS